MFARLYFMFQLWRLKRDFKRLGSDLDSNLRYLKTLRTCIRGLYNESVELHIVASLGFETIDMFLFYLDGLHGQMGRLESVPNELLRSYLPREVLLRLYLRTNDTGADVSMLTAIDETIKEVSKILETLDNLKKESMRPYYLRMLKPIEHELHVFTKTIYEGVVLSYVRRQRNESNKDS